MLDYPDKFARPKVFAALEASLWSARAVRLGMPRGPSRGGETITTPTFLSDRPSGGGAIPPTARHVFGPRPGIARASLSTEQLRGRNGVLPASRAARDIANGSVLLSTRCYSMLLDAAL